MSKTLTLLASALACAVATSATLAAPIDVANLYGAATANSAYSPAAYAIDNNNVTAWNAGDHGSSGDPNWLVVDLGSSFAVDTIDLYWGGIDGLFPGYTTTYNLYYGVTGSDWTLIGSGTFVDEDPAQMSASYLFNPDVGMRYVKYEVVGGTHWSGIAEISVWSEGQGNVPEPASLALLSAGLLGIAALRCRVARP